MKHSYLIALILLTSCGNPHLISKKKGITNLPLIAEQPSLQQDFNLLKIETLAGEKELKAKIINTNKSNSQTVRVTNQDTKEMEISYQFVDGSHFEFNGGNFPGTNGTCSNLLGDQASCDLDIIFHSEDEGVFLDKLIVTFKPKDSDLVAKVIEFPLSGERQNQVIANPLLKILTSNGESTLDFGKTKVDQDISGKLILLNIGNVPLEIETAFEKDNSFNFNGGKYPGSTGTCTSELEVNQTCTLDINFKESKAGLYSDNLITTYKSLKGEQLEHQLKTPLHGEKTAKSVTPGDLVASEILGNKVDFGNVEVGSSSAKQVELTNIGSLAVKINETTFQGGSQFSYNGGSFPGLRGTCNEVVQPGNCLIDIIYKPNAIGKHTGTLTLKTDNKKSLVLSLSGKGKAKEVCYEENEIVLSAIPKARAEVPVLPYLSKAAGTDAKLQTLYGTEVNGYYSALDMYTVKDSQVYVQYEMPKIKDEVTSINFGVEVQKIVLDNFKDTESLCLSTSSNVRKCSGKEFELASWEALKNWKFWDKYSAPVSSLYTEQFDQSKWNCGDKSCMRLKMVYNLESIFDLNSKEMQTVIKGEKVSLVFSDDTRMLKLPKLLIKTKKKIECK